MSRKSYGQYCGLARSLDVVGDRWSLLIVRELLVAPAHYVDLHRGLPGIATNLLAQRLRQLEADGVILRRISPDAHGIHYDLTDLGRGLDQVVEAFVRWSTPLMVSGPCGDLVRPGWLVVALRGLLGARHEGAPADLEISVDGAVLHVARRPGQLAVAEGPAPAAAARLTAPAEVVLGLASGALPEAAALAQSQLDGDIGALRSAFGYAVGPSRAGP